MKSILLMVLCIGTVFVEDFGRMPLPVQIPVLMIAALNAPVVDNEQKKFRYEKNAKSQRNVRPPKNQKFPKQKNIHCRSNK